MKPVAGAGAAAEPSARPGPTAHPGPDPSVPAHQAVLSRLHATSLPLLDDEVSPAHAQLFTDLLDAQRALECSLSSAVMTPRQIAWTGALRWTAAIAALGLLIAGAAWLLKTPQEAFAHASGVWESRPEFRPEMAVDDDTDTEFLLPDEAPGWIEVRYSPARDITKIKLLNAHNRNYNDRGTREYVVHVYSRNEEVQTIEGEFDAIEPDPEFVEHAARHRSVDRIRIEVTSWFRRGGGFGEIAVE